MYVIFIMQKKASYKVYSHILIIIIIIAIIKSRWAGHAACMGEMRNAHKILVGKLERKRLPQH
jgi:hypothetical protein